MSQNRNQNSTQQSSKDLPVHVVEQIIETQKQQLILQAQELKLREKELDVNAKLAEKQMAIQGELLKNKPSETRKTFKSAAIFIIVFLLVFLGFFGYCVETGHEEFATKIFGYLMYGVTTVGGYFAGKKSAHKGTGSKPDEPEQAQVVD
jgi:hypothetical protein